jgi:hypothetical protein
MLRLEVGEEGLRVVDVAAGLRPPLAHQLLVALGDGDPALHLTVSATVLLVDEARYGR